MTATTLSPPVASLRRTVAVASRHIHVTLRNPPRLFDMVVWPVVDAVLYGSIALFMQQQAPTGATRTALTVIAGIIMWHVVYQAQIAVSSGFNEEAWSRQLPSLLTTPLRPVEWLAGTALQGMLKVVIGVSSVTVAAVVLYGFDLAPIGLDILPVIALLLLNGWALAFVVIGLVLRFGAAAEALVWGLLFVVLPLSGALYPTSVLPGFLQPLSALLPPRYVFDAARAAMTGDGATWGQLGVAAFATVVFMTLALVFTSAMLRTFQRRGFISRYQ
ncbi:ABC transporter permease [Solwaraspora sp. WMMD406]|uniref:ABC transporter permease n=1 Tax=Solwaraspora sp. WMMD406 TaxID=3016095 RepID=UPI002416985A|nr:ABC transporter permease [Solwaraspora sp. WMMD406]MDG4765740.1 ABC transporter permease [Solwaraspora sp. WMMD406]